MLALGMRVDVYRYTSISCGKNCKRCISGWHAIDAAQCWKGERGAPGNIDDLQTNLVLPTNFESTLVLASPSAFSIGKADQFSNPEGSFLLEPSLRDQLINRAWADSDNLEELEFQHSSATADYAGVGPLLPIHVSSAGTQAHVINSGMSHESDPGPGDYRGSLTLLRVNGLSVFAQPVATLQQDMQGSGEGLKTVKQQAFSGSLAVTEEVWPAPVTNSQHPSPLTWLAPGSGVGFVLPGKMSREDALNTLKEENTKQLFQSLILVSFLSIFSSIWSCCGFGFSTFASEGSEGGDKIGLICQGLWAITFLCSFVMFFVCLFTSLTNSVALVAVCILSVCCVCLCCLVGASFMKGEDSGSPCNSDNE